MDKEKPVKVRFSKVKVRLGVHCQRGADIQQNRLLHPLRKVDAEFMSDPRAAIMRADEEFISKTEVVHHGNAVLRHGGFGVSRDIVWFGGGAIAAEVDEDDGVLFSQVRDDTMPDVVALGEAMDEEEGW